MLNSSTGGLWDFLTAGGARLAGSYTASGTTTNYVPLVDAAGTVIALVNPASPDQNPPPETITYDPSGTPSASGSANGWPFLYHGAEHESIDPNQYYYSGDGAFYSAQIMRSMSMTSAQGTSGPGGGPGPGQASLPPVGSAPNAFDPGRRLESVGQGYEVGYSIAAPGVAAGLFAPETPILPIALVAGGAAAVAYDFVSFFQDLFGGSPDYPPNYFTFQHRLDRPHGGPHPLYTAFIGMPRGIVVDQQGPHCLCGDPHPCASSPLAMDPSGMGFNSTIFSAFVRLTHPLHMIVATGFALVTGAIMDYAGYLVIAAGCADPTPAEVISCPAAIALGYSIIALGTTAGVAGAAIAGKATVDSVKEDWLP